MPASLSEAFGENYDSYPPSDIQQKRKKKPVKQKKYGTEIPAQRFTAPEPKRELNVTIGSYSEEDQYLPIKNQGMTFEGDEFGPTDYNIKPKDVQEYMFQMNKNYADGVNTNMINRTFGKPTNDPNLIDDNDSNDDYYAPVPSYPSKGPTSQPTQTSSTTSAPSTKSNFENVDVDPRLVDFNEKLDLILKKLNHFDEPVQENIHDIILFVIFGIFVIFILDSIYRVGKMTM
jgi:hypothetical protein